MYFEGKTVSWCAGEYTKIPLILIVISAVVAVASIAGAALGMMNENFAVCAVCIILVVLSLALLVHGITLRTTKYTLSMNEFILARWRRRIIVPITDVNRVDVTSACPDGAIRFTVGKVMAAVYLRDGTCYAISCGNDGFLNGIRERSVPTDDHRDWRDNGPRLF